MITIATWNVNSIKTRLQHLLDWLQECSPDIVLLQETKCTDETFPRMEIEELGYNIAIHGQKSYNGVAILSKFPLEDIRTGLPGDDNDKQARYIEAVVSASPRHAIRVASVYVPNGQEPGSEKFAYKLAFFARLYAHIQHLLGFEEILVVGGDYNVAPEAIDVHNPQKMAGSICFHPLEHQAFRALLYLGMHNAFRSLHPNRHQFSWWDYRAGAWSKNEGMLIDHLLLSPEATDRLQRCEVHEGLRAKEKASDHVPVVCELAVA